MTVGAPVSETTTVAFTAAVAVFPALSTTCTSKRCWPAETDVKVWGDVHAVNAWASRRHRKRSTSVEVEPNTIWTSWETVSVEPSVGEVMDTCGGVRSTCTTTEAAALRLVALSTAFT